MRDQFFGFAFQNQFLVVGVGTGDSGGHPAAPALANTNGTISVATAGHPVAPRLTNINGTITAEAA